MVYAEMKSDSPEVWLFSKLIYLILIFSPLFTQDSPESDIEREKDKKERERESEKDRARQRSESKHKSPTKKRPGKDSVSLLLPFLPGALRVSGLLRRGGRALSLCSESGAKASLLFPFRLPGKRPKGSGRGERRRPCARAP